LNLTPDCSAWMRQWPGASALIFCFLLLSALNASMTPRAAFADNHPQNVLVLLSSQPELPTNQAIVKGLEGSLKTNPDIQVYYEFLDAKRFPSEAHLTENEHYLRAKYAGLRFNVAIAIGRQALNFLVSRDTGLISPSAIVFGGISDGQILPPNLSASGVITRFDIVKTLDLAQRLQPHLKHIAVVTGASRFDKSWEGKAQEKLAGLSNKYEFTYLAGLPMNELLNRLAKLPENSAVLYLSVSVDGDGIPFVSRDVAQKLSRASSAPIYSVYDTYVGHGIVGGFMDTFEAIGRQVGDLALRRLSGQILQGSSVEPSHTHNFIVDWRELSRWGLWERALPPDTEVRFKTASYWQKELVILFLAVLLALSYLVAKFYREVKNRRLAEQAATDSRHQIELSVSAANLGLWEWNPITDKVWASDHCRQLLGLGREAVVPREDFLNCLQGEDRTLAVARMLKAMATGNQCEAEYALTQPDGSVRWLSSRASPRNRNNGKPDRLLGVLVDITERKQAEHEAAEQRKQLTHLTRVSVLGALSGALAHELNQPLTAILSNAHAARRILARKPHDLAEVRTILDEIVDDDRRAGDVIRHLRTLLRREEGAKALIDMNQLVATALDIARSDLGLRGITVSRQLDTNCRLVEGDAVQLQQVVLNLIVNACDAMSRKPVSERSLRIVSKVTAKGKLRVSVVDRGEGISESNLKTLFEPFHTTKALGLGLGLPICNWIIAAHGGKLLAHNNPDGGATFSFDLPIPVEVANEWVESDSVPG
jgi:PAS domain S-box-containing protein